MCVRERQRRKKFHPIQNKHGY
uniref:Uncharacterized protein n=1 Tax=Rhizophora mucronata TaxID=61149 RepID=A0A2P2R562_RHIMU